MSDQPVPARQPEVPPAGWQKAWGAALTVLATLGVSLLEVFLAPLAIGTHRIPVSLVLLLLTSPLLCVLGRWALAHPLGALLPLPFWFIVSVLGNYKTPTGDLLLTAGNWVAGVYFFGGLLVWLASIVLVCRPELFRGPSRVGDR